MQYTLSFERQVINPGPEGVLWPLPDSEKKENSRKKKNS
mgnify:CR=1 FL=1|jgi:hypothetical protein